MNKRENLPCKDLREVRSCLEDDLATAVDAADALFDALVLELLVAKEAFVHLTPPMPANS